MTRVGSLHAKAKVAVIGGSLAGCSIAIVLRRAGCRVDVYERSPTDLQDRGAGIVLPNQLQSELIDRGFLPPDYPGCPIRQRDWVVHDGSFEGRVVWRQPVSGVANHWGRLWRALRAAIPDACYHNGLGLIDYANSAEGISFQTSDGERRRADLLVAADGYRSLVREQMTWGSESDYAGYVLWRGNFEDSRVADRAVIARLDERQSWLSACYDGGHSVLYMIPGAAETPGQDERRINWGIYSRPPDGLVLHEPSSIPEGSVTQAMYAQFDALLGDSLPAQIAALIRLSPREQVSIQPIYDELAVHFSEARVMLVGDAAAVVRPHTASGATKALQDALVFERLSREHDDLDALLAAYGAERLENCNALVEVGRRIGRAQVEETPEWSAMSPADFARWNEATLAGQSLYLYEDVSNTGGEAESHAGEPDVPPGP